MAEIREGKKQCRLCKEWIHVKWFGTFLDKKKDWIAPQRYINSRCKPCAKKVSTEYKIKNKDSIREKSILERRNLLQQIHNGYGNKCNCCEENNPLFLTIDHINNDGYKLRPRNKNGEYSSNVFSGSYYKKIIKAGFPSDLQLLCWNCNCGKARNKGICPHKK